MFTLTSESATPSYDSPKEVDKMLIIHNTGNGYIEIEISVDALQQHLDHRDKFIDEGGNCEPPYCG